MLYDWLKEKPQVRGPMLTKWSQCMKDPDWDLCCTESIKYLDRIGAPLKDSTLFFYDLWLKEKMTRRTRLQPFEKIFRLSFLKSKLADYLYTYITESDYSNKFEMATDKFPLWVDTDADYFDKLMQLNVSNAAFRYVFGVIRHRAYHIGLEAQMLLMRIYDVTDQYIANEFFQRYATCIQIKTLVLNFTDRALKQLMVAPTERQSNVIQMLNDISVYSDTVINSLNVVDRLHQVGIIEAENELKKTYGDAVYAYNLEFKELVKAHGFTLPTGPAAIVARGQKHHNCVSQYADRHKAWSKSNMGSRYCRLLFNAVGTVELDIRSFNGIIYAVTVEQYKGVNNSNKHDNEEELYKLCGALALKSVDILKVEVVSVKQ